MEDPSCANCCHYHPPAGVRMGSCHIEEDDPRRAIDPWEMGLDLRVPVPKDGWCWKHPMIVASLELSQP